MDKYQELSTKYEALSTDYQNLSAKYMSLSIKCDWLQTVVESLKTEAEPTEAPTAYYIPIKDIVSMKLLEPENHCNKVLKGEVFDHLYKFTGSHYVLVYQGVEFHVSTSNLLINGKPFKLPTESEEEAYVVDILTPTNANIIPMCDELIFALVDSETDREALKHSIRFIEETTEWRIHIYVEGDLR